MKHLNKKELPETYSKKCKCDNQEPSKRNKASQGYERTLILPVNPPKHVNNKNKDDDKVNQEMLKVCPQKKGACSSCTMRSEQLDSEMIINIKSPNMDYSDKYFRQIETRNSKQRDVALKHDWNMNQSYQSLPNGESRDGPNKSKYGKIFNNRKYENREQTNLINYYANTTDLTSSKLQISKKFPKSINMKNIEIDVKTLKSRIQNNKIENFDINSNKLKPFKEMTTNSNKDANIKRTTKAKQKTCDVSEKVYDNLPRVEKPITNYIGKFYIDNGIKTERRIPLYNVPVQKFKFTEYIYDKKGVPCKKIITCYEDEILAVKGLLRLVDDLKRQRFK